MNERIRQLAEQAGIAVWGDAVYMYHPSETLDSTVMTKFAELIVAECAMFVVLELEGKVGSAIADATANRLEEHFGVEE